MAVQTRENELRAMKSRELMRFATKLGIKGSWDMKKSEVIEAILGASAKCSECECGDGVCTCGAAAELESAKANVEVDDHADDNVEVAGETEKDAANVDMSRKMPYIERAEIGTVVAFRLASGKVKSAKIIKKSTKSRRFMLETSYGAQYIASYEDIVWVRTGKRWPRGIYRLLKGVVDDAADQKK